MARRFSGNMRGERYLANTSASKREVHDLDSENTAAYACQIDEIISGGNDRPFDTLTEARAAGFHNCAWCLSAVRPANGTIANSAIRPVRSRAQASSLTPMPREPEWTASEPPAVLVVDDDPSMRTLAAQALRSAGYKVTTAKDAEVAFAALKERSVDLIVCDVAMPGMDGRAFGQELMNRPHRIPILFISAVEYLPATLPGAFLRKPFRYEELVSVVGEILARNGGRSGR